MDEAVDIQNATKRFGDDVAVDGVSLRVAPGTILGIIGPSGAGKTTLVRMLTGAIAPTEGEIRVMGEDPRSFRRRTRERIGYMPQQFALFPDLTTRENVDFAASLFGMIWWRRHRRTRQVLEFVDLWSVRSRRASQLSGGMQRRLELASALVHDPAIAFLDEPTAGIDPLLRDQIWKGLHALREDGRTLLVTTQYVNEAESCDAVALISEGRLIALGGPDQLRRQAVGGDTVLIETSDTVDASMLRSLPAVRRIEQRGPRQLNVTVDDAATSLPDVVEAISQAGGEVQSASEVRPSFDEVFALLVEGDRAKRPTRREDAADQDHGADAADEIDAAGTGDTSVPASAGDASIAAGSDDTSVADETRPDA
jgi:ABC-2 type transport system ATP-binding protein